MDEAATTTVELRNIPFSGQAKHDEHPWMAERPGIGGGISVLLPPENKKILRVFFFFFVGGISVLDFLFCIINKQTNVFGTNFCSFF